MKQEIVETEEVVVVNMTFYESNKEDVIVWERVLENIRYGVEQGTIRVK